MYSLTRPYSSIILALLSLGLFFSITINAQIPPGYYDGTQGLSGTALKSALHDIIKNHRSQSYSSLWDHFEQTDKKGNGTVWDMYSDIPGGTPPYVYNFTASDQCGTYSQEGDCYNREHSFPQSWFNSGMPMKSDLFHLVPTDGFVNGKRGDLPFGDVGATTWTSMNGSKLGDCITSGYSGTVFEPIDGYKGDMARSFFYMATRYYSEDGSWPGSPMVNGAEPLPWARDMLMEWAENDPVSQKEINRNNAVYQIQDNRNPFIDHPEFIQSIWGSFSLIITENSLQIHLWPVPFLDVVNISIPETILSKDLSVTVTDAAGKEIKADLDFGPDRVVIHTTTWPRGFYLFSIRSENGVQVLRAIK